MEALEQSNDVAPDFVRINLTGYTSTEITTIKTNIQVLANTWVNSYSLYYHYCKHDENKPCEIGVI